VLWTGRPAPRSDFKTRGKENFLCSVLEMVGSLCWAGLGWLLTSLATQGATWMAVTAAVVLALGLGVLLVAWLLRRHPV
jgi:ABC-2 type transport system permease protein